jgi:hypothetical protein
MKVRLNVPLEKFNLPKEVTVQDESKFKNAAHPTTEEDDEDDDDGDNEFGFGTHC